MSTLFVNNLNTASGSTITVPTGKVVVGTDGGTFKSPGQVIQTVSYDLANGYTNSLAVNISSGSVFLGGGAITPKYSTSKILCMGVNVLHNDTAGTYGFLRVIRTVSGGSDVIIATPGNATGYQYTGNGKRIEYPHFVLDTPNTTSSVQYRHRFDHGSGTIDNQWNYSHACMMLMEIAQ